MVTYPREPSRQETTICPVRPVLIPDQSGPPLPDPIPNVDLAREPLQPIGPFPPQFRALRPGCYLVRYKPLFPFSLHFDGTIRVQRDGFNTIASGDLYRHLLIAPIAEPNPAAGIPIFPRGRYSHYMRITQILEFITFGNSFTLGFELHRFNAPTNSWTNEGAFSAEMSWTTAPAGFPSSSDYLTGLVKNAAGAVVGNLTMGWVSSYLRRAVVEIDRVTQSEAPLENGAGRDWLEIFDEVGWDVDVEVSDSQVPEASGAGWSDSELHSYMLQWRESADLDGEWRYHVLCVRELDSTLRGIMYDAFGGDSNNIPREGAAIASHWVIPNADPWGLVKGQRFGAATAPYFRTAVHEIGHAQGLYHNTGDNGFMNTTDLIAASPGTFPNNISWAYHPDDQKRLRHLPDIESGPAAFRSVSPTAASRSAPTTWCSTPRASSCR
jgi:hypothetical protein